MGSDNASLPIGPWRRAVKRPLPLQVRFAPASGVLNTLEGPVAYAAGDAICTGAAGEQWPVVRAHFMATHAPLDGQANGADGAYRKLRIEVDVAQLSTAASVERAPGSLLSGQAGDWVIRSEDGAMWIVAWHIFDATYQLLD